ncbi:MFS transporter [Paraburkholderia metrosideri]|uniref:MFS transporter n=1 Tax=Paraburkholderia metrosideri TaxID=580937 RepID=A0ABW9E5N5_9BURK
MTKRYSGWRVVAGSAVGMGFSMQMFIATGFTFLAAALSKAFGWTLIEVAAGATFYLLGQVIGFPLAGTLLDRFGTRRVVTLGICGVALLMLVLSRIQALWQLYACLFAMGIVGALGYTISYLRALVLWFDRRRGVAIGVAASGLAFGGVIYPFATERIISMTGWSAVPLAIAALQLLVVLPWVLALVRDSPAPYGLAADGRPLGEPVPPRRAQAGAVSSAQACSLTLGQALHTIDFWMLATVYLVGGAAVYGLITNSVHILWYTASLKTAEVAKVQAVAGITLLLGRPLGGFLLDRVGTRTVAIAMTLLTAVGILGYAWGDRLGTVMIAAFVLGLATGGEGDVLPYMTAKYFGPESFGKIYGVLAAFFAVGTAIGPLAYASLATLMDSPTKPLMVMSGATMAASFCFLFVGRRDLPTTVRAITTGGIS